MTGVWQTTVPKTKTGKQVGTAYLNLFALKLKQNYTDYNVELSYQTTRSGCLCRIFSCLQDCNQKSDRRTLGLLNLQSWKHSPRGPPGEKSAQGQERLS